MTQDLLRECRQTLQLCLIKVVQDLFPEEKLKIPYSILDGIYCELTGSLVSPREAKTIETALRNWIGQNRTLKFLGKYHNTYRYQLGETVLESIYPAYEDTSNICEFEIFPFPPGFILRFGDETENPNEFVLPSKLSATFAETQRWLENLDLDYIEDVNAYIKNGRSLELITTAEALQEKKIADIADRILQERKSIRMIMIAGPSSSGKTTFAQRLSTQLRVNGLKPVPLSLDDYFVDRENTPLDSLGQPDFDVLEALDLPLLNQQLNQLINGQAVEVPLFDFLTGRRAPRGRFLQLHPDNVLVIEGIHALNPHLLPTVNRNIIFNIYISALFQLNIDSYNRVPTTEARLIRRIVRDNNFRGTEPERTLKQWASVRRGEIASVFKYQEEADVMFNSSLIYELNALRPLAEPLLTRIKPDSPYFPVVTRLLNLLSFFEPMDTSKVPLNSILREFCGGSIYSEDIP